jgi:Rod binding domain-containing protein
MDMPGIPMDPSFLAVESAGTKNVSGNENQSQETLKKVARDFETVFLHQMLNVMKDSVPDEESEDSTGEQIQGMYWSFMAQAIGEEGGVGLWKDIYSAIAGQRTEYERRDTQSIENCILDETI